MTQPIMELYESCEHTNPKDPLRKQFDDRKDAARDVFCNSKYRSRALDALVQDYLKTYKEWYKKDRTADADTAMYQHRRLVSDCVQDNGCEDQDVHDLLLNGFGDFLCRWYCATHKLSIPLPFSPIPPYTQES